MRIFFAFENPLPSIEADAEVFTATARYLAPSASGSWLHAPTLNIVDRDAMAGWLGMPLIRCLVPIRPAALRHFCCGLAMLLRKEFWRADLVYTRNLWIAWLAVLLRRRVVFDHYRPWPDQVPPLQWPIYRLFCNRHFLVNICHSEYTRRKYLCLGIPSEKLRCVRNGFEPERLRIPVPIEDAKRAIGVAVDKKTIVYTGRINHKKGLNLMIEAARRLPDHLFIMVGSYGEGPVETQARGLANIRIVQWQTHQALSRYIFAADVLLIPPSSHPLAEFGSTVLPLKLFLYMASGRPILAGNTADVREALKDQENALLCRPDCADALAAGIERLLSDTALATRLAAKALVDSKGLTWAARAQKIAAIIEARLGSERAERGSWDGARSLAWMRQSRNWLIHLVRQRSWVLPPDPSSFTEAPPATCG